MPKKKTYEQLERKVESLGKRLEDAHSMNQSIWKDYKGVCQEKTALKEQLEQVRANAEELNDIIKSDELATLTGRAEAAETNLAAFRSIALSQIELVKMAASPTMRIDAAKLDPRVVKFRPTCLFPGKEIDHDRH